MPLWHFQAKLALLFWLYLLSLCIQDFKRQIYNRGWSTKWPPKLGTNMVVASCMFNIHKCMIQICVRTKILVNMMYHTFVYVEHTWSYTQFCIYIIYVNFGRKQPVRTGRFSGYHLNEIWLPEMAFFSHEITNFWQFLLTILAKSIETQ